MLKLILLVQGNRKLDTNYVKIEEHYKKITTYWCYKEWEQFSKEEMQMDDI